MTLKIETLLNSLCAVQQHREIRLFVCWLARQTELVDRSALNIIDDVETSLDSEEQPEIYWADLKEWNRRLRFAAEKTYLFTGAADACSILASLGCLEADPFEATRRTVFWSLKWYEQVTNDVDHSVFAGHIEDKLEAIWTRVDSETKNARKSK